MTFRRENITPADRQYNTRNTAAVQKEWVEAIMSAIAHDTARISAWEMDFIESVETQLGDGRTLSEKQSEVLERIYNKI
jgi:hypothetical protein